MKAAGPLFHSKVDLWHPASLSPQYHKSKLAALSLGAEGPLHAGAQGPLLTD